MEYRQLVATYDRLDATASTIEKTEILAAAFDDAGELLPELTQLARGRLFAPWEPDDLGVSSSLTARAIANATGVAHEQVESWWRETGDLGDAAALAVENRSQATLVSETLDVATVYETLRGLADYEGAGSQDRRIDDIAGLLADADPDEARYVVRTVVGAMRLGVGEGTIRDAIAAAFLDGSEAAVGAVERAYEVTNDFRTVSETARTQGREGLAALDVELFRPVKAMLARKAESVADALDSTERPLLEYKYDGMRAKIHVRDGEVRVFTRRLEDVTAQFPDVVVAVEAELDAENAIVEAEVVGYDPETGGPIPFQELSKRIKRTSDIEELAAEYPVTVQVFDCLYRDDESLLESPLTERLDHLDALLDADGETLERATHRRPESLDDAESFYSDALAAGQEGIIVKNLDAAYQPGSRVGYMQKVKPTMEPLDLVVVQAKWSEGRKSEWLGRLRLACWDAEREELREIGRIFSGLTDDELREITAKLEPLVQSVEGRTAKLRPEVVIEVEYEEIQSSTTYDSGYALRFPRFGGFREDLAPEDADRLERVERLYEEQ
ncbi:ATP-dependent DNA ligase [Haloarcula nitratireducens]|uniref:DNA ligase n=1 Tax=Haloarcula nitratireducens TaxID=2487749 RepID=A0AAW4PE73_9EURY|nr:ATP-dependent DNA ligase [Halomicroarcula nitratireducens]MBX0296149.1 ATP-dependent DNA ligase [Halomicroarcula nitratireducens]